MAGSLGFYNIVFGNAGQCLVYIDSIGVNTEPLPVDVATYTSATRRHRRHLETLMTIIDSCSFLTLHYRMSGPDGQEVISTFGGMPATLSMGGGQLSPAIEQHLIGLDEGTKATFELAPGDAFGPHNPEAVQWVARSMLNQLGDPDERYNPGDVVQFPTPDGLGQYAGAVVACKDDGSAVLFDFNHPLAGQAVTFEVHVIGVL